MLMGLDHVSKQVSVSLVSLGVGSKIPYTWGSRGHVDSVSLAATNVKMLSISQTHFSSGFQVLSVTEVNGFFLYL